MSRATNGIATELDIKYGLDNDLFLPNSLPNNYTNRAITKERVLQYVIADEELLTVHSNNQLVKWDLIKPKFHTTLTNRDFAATGGTFPFKISSEYGWNLTESVSWLSTSITSGTSGVSDFNLVFQNNTSTSDRTTTIVFTELVTLKTISVTVTQIGVVATHKQITLYHDSQQQNICNVTNLTPFWIPINDTFLTTTKLYSNSAGTISATAGYYKEPFGNTWRYWNGGSFTNSGNCI